MTPSHDLWRRFRGFVCGWCVGLILLIIVFLFL